MPEDLLKELNPTGLADGGNNLGLVITAIMAAAFAIYKIYLMFRSDRRAETTSETHSQLFSQQSEMIQRLISRNEVLTKENEARAAEIVTLRLENAAFQIEIQRLKFVESARSQPVDDKPATPTP